MAELLPLRWSWIPISRPPTQADLGDPAGESMKLMKKQSEERVTVMTTHGGSEQRFRYPAHEEISEISCSDAHVWQDHDQPADADGQARAIAS